MWQGVVESLHTVAAKSEPLATLPEVTAVAGKGLEGDRYLLGVGTYSKKPGPDRQITLFETEVLAALRREYDIRVAPEQTRRNVITRGVPLAHLVGTEFMVGAVRLRGVRPCDPCPYLAKLLDERRLYEALLHRGGLRCEILTSGAIRVGDLVRPA